VLYGKLRPYLDKVLVADEDGVCTTEIIPLRGLADLDSGYLRLALKAPGFIAYATDSTHGMNLPRLGTDKARMAAIPVPPCAEQKRIVAKVDELMARCDELEAKQQATGAKLVALNCASLRALAEPSGASLAPAWRRVRNHFDHLYATPETVAELRQTILQLAVMGRLVPQDPNDERASELLKMIRAMKQQPVTGAIRTMAKHLPTVEQQDERIPSVWELSTMAEICEFIVDGSHNPPARAHQGLPYITARNVIGGRVDLGGCTFISDNAVEAATKRYAPRDGDVLVTCVGTIGRTAVVRNAGTFAIDRNIAALRPHTAGILPEYLDLVLRCPEVQRSMSVASGSTAQPHVYLKEIRSLVCPVPPRAEQTRIVAKVDQLMSLCDALETRLRQTQVDADNLVDAIVRGLVADSSGRQR
jgi:type I restriction enzyme S subunit